MLAKVTLRPIFVGVKTRWKVVAQAVCMLPARYTANTYKPKHSIAGTLGSLFMGGASGIIAQTACYPLDTVRRRMQMKGK
jgi:hypothetical protein